MDLTPLQFKMLQQYEKLRGQSPAYVFLTALHWKRAVVFNSFMGMLTVWAYFTNASEFCYLYAGMWISTVIAYVARIRTLVTVWPVMSEIMDWDRIERAIADRRIDKTRVRPTQLGDTTQSACF